MCWRNSLYLEFWNFTINQSSAVSHKRYTVKNDADLKQNENRYNIFARLNNKSSSLKIRISTKRKGEITKQRSSECSAVWRDWMSWLVRRFVSLSVANVTCLWCTTNNFQSCTFRETQNKTELPPLYRTWPTGRSFAPCQMLRSHLLKNSNNFVWNHFTCHFQMSVIVANITDLLHHTFPCHCFCHCKFAAASSEQFGDMAQNYHIWNSNSCISLDVDELKIIQANEWTGIVPFSLNSKHFGEWSEQLIRTQLLF